jgi:trans-2,3-dihydro-3-hydroxyanthranilate isomerase
MASRNYRYWLIDVFAERAFTGSPVAVFTDARGLDETRMRRVAREFNRAQTAFVFPPSVHGGVPRIRLFTPTRELARAEQPTIGTAFALECESKSKVAVGPKRVVFEDSDGPVSVCGGAPRVMTVRQALPTFGAFYEDYEAVLAMLSLTPDDWVPDAPMRAVSAGVPYLVVLLRERAALERVRFRQDIWERTLRHFEAPRLLAFCLEPERSDSFAKMRVFTPDLGVVEDPATETACGPLVGYLLGHGLFPKSARQQPSLVIEQGAELDRPSFLHVAAEIGECELRGLRVGGQCVVVGEGFVTAGDVSC